MNNKTDKRSLVDLSTKTFIQVVALLFALMLVAIILTYVIPKGRFRVDADGCIDYLAYEEIKGAGGIPFSSRDPHLPVPGFPGVEAAPVLVFSCLPKAAIYGKMRKTSKI